ncbi:MAG: hypothetical protein IPP17_20565 [Bacteroidetes bacterium]|nr:hypothetical protein [Bacteroidota bacterium]
MQFAPKKNGRPNPEQPSAPPPTDDPHGGISAEDDKDDPNQVDMPTRTTMRRPPMTISHRLRSVANTEIWRIGNGSDVGQTGDWMLVLRGQGFFESERPPVVHIGDAIRLTDVYVGNRGKELFACIPPEVALQVIASDFEKISVQNPADSSAILPSRWVPFLIQRPTFVVSLETAPKATFKFGEYFWE